MPLLVFSTCSKELRDCHFALPAKCEVNEGKKIVFRRPIESHGIANALLNARKAAEAVKENEKKGKHCAKLKAIDATLNALCLPIMRNSFSAVWEIAFRIPSRFSLRSSETCWGLRKKIFLCFNSCYLNGWFANNFSSQQNFHNKLLIYINKPSETDFILSARIVCKIGEKLPLQPPL